MLDASGMHSTIVDQGFDTVDALRAADMAEGDLEELAEVAAETAAAGELEFARPEVRHRVLRVLRLDTLARWLSCIFAARSSPPPLPDGSIPKPTVVINTVDAKAKEHDVPYQHHEVALVFQRAGFMALADILETGLTDADLKELGFSKMGTRRLLLRTAGSSLEKLLQAGAQRGRALDGDLSPAERAAHAEFIEDLLDENGALPAAAPLGTDVKSPPDGVAAAAPRPQQISPKLPALPEAKAAVETELKPPAPAPGGGPCSAAAAAAVPAAAGTARIARSLLVRPSSWFAATPKALEKALWGRLCIHQKREGKGE